MTAGRPHAVGIDGALARRACLGRACLGRAYLGRACLGRARRLRLRLRRGGRLFALLGPTAREQAEETQGTKRDLGAHTDLYVPGPRALQDPIGWAPRSVVTGCTPGPVLVTRSSCASHAPAKPGLPDARDLEPLRIHPDRAHLVIADVSGPAQPCCHKTY